jgi:hypothetical protein
MGWGGGGGSALAQGPKWRPKKGPTIQIVYHKNLALPKAFFEFRRRCLDYDIWGTRHEFFCIKVFARESEE